MRKSTLLWLVLAAFCGTVLFHTSQKVHDEREKLAALDVSIGKEEESLRVLNAEWSYLNQPERLEKLARTYLNMTPLKGSQFIRVEDIPLRSAAPVTTTAAAPASDTMPAIKPRLASAETPKPAINIRKPVAPAFLRKPAHTGSAPDKGPADDTGSAETRSFGDVMKSLHAGIE